MDSPFLSEEVLTLPTSYEEASERALWYELATEAAFSSPPSPTSTSPTVESEGRQLDPVRRYELSEVDAEAMAGDAPDSAEPALDGPAPDELDSIYEFLEALYDQAGQAEENAATGNDAMDHRPDLAEEGGPGNAAGQQLWSAMVGVAVRSGVTDPSKLTNMVFFARHPELKGRPITASERHLAREWLDIRDTIVRPALEGRAAAVPAAAPTGGGANTYRRVAGDITAAFESGGEVGKLQTRDKGVISYGRHQATLAGGNLHRLLAHYVTLSASPTAVAMRGYLPRTKRKDRSLAHDQRFLDLLTQAAAEPAMAQAQEDTFREAYWLPAVRMAADARIGSALGHAVLYDTTVQGGAVYRFPEVTCQLGGVVGDVVNGKPIAELDFLRSWVTARIDATLRNSERDLCESAHLERAAVRAEARAGAASGPEADRERADAAALRDKAKRLRRNGEDLKTSATMTRGPTWRALVDSGDLDLRGDAAGQIQLAGKKGAAITGLRPGATVE